MCLFSALCIDIYMVWQFTIVSLVFCPTFTHIHTKVSQSRSLVTHLRKMYSVGVLSHLKVSHVVQLHVFLHYKSTLSRFLLRPMKKSTNFCMSKTYSCATTQFKTWNKRMQRCVIFFCLWNWMGWIIWYRGIQPFIWYPRSGQPDKPQGNSGAAY